MHPHHALLYLFLAYFTYGTWTLWLGCLRFSAALETYIQNASQHWLHSFFMTKVYDYLAKLLWAFFSRHYGAGYVTLPSYYDEAELLSPQMLMDTPGANGASVSITTVAIAFIFVARKWSRNM